MTLDPQAVADMQAIPTPHWFVVPYCLTFLGHGWHSPIPTCFPPRGLELQTKTGAWEETLTKTVSVRLVALQEGK